MVANYTAIVKKDGVWWLGWIEEVPGVNAQEKTKSKLMASLKEVLAEALDGLVSFPKFAIVFKGVK